jgi:hypothetical protein
MCRDIPVAEPVRGAVVTVTGLHQTATANAAFSCHGGLMAKRQSPWLPLGVFGIRGETWTGAVPFFFGTAIENRVHSRAPDRKRAD